MSIVKIAAGAVASLAFAAPAVAGPYANVETNVGWQGGDYSGAVTETHIGYNWDLDETSSLYIQGGPAFVAVADVSTETEYSGKVGVSTGISEEVEIYGELSAITADQSFEDDLSLGLKAGFTYSF